MHRIAIAPLLAPLILLTACGQADNDPGPGGVTVGEAKALDEAAEMIEQRRLPPEALETPAGDSGEEAKAATTPAQEQ
jgi:hypothetical protein